MELHEIVAKHQKYYFEFFSKASTSCQGAKELLVDRKNDDSEEVYRLYRFDCLEKDNKGDFGIIEYNTDSFLNHDPIAFDYDNLEIELNPLFWNGVELEIWGLNENMSTIVQWAEKWIDAKDLNNIPKNGAFSGLIHSILRPEITKEKTIIYIDFGTSEIDSFLQLMDVLKNNGAKKVIIHSKSLIESE